MTKCQSPGSACIKPHNQPPVDKPIIMSCFQIAWDLWVGYFPSLIGTQSLLKLFAILLTSNPKIFPRDSPDNEQKYGVKSMTHSVLM